ncbi:MAG: CPBP family intramembrane metalloprotease [Candidatus Lokiarchaeota archaeon]|nr:CPBP family intramembrane metalloprotease [Candidatus Lokiarchaeota archaeon]
MSAFLIFALTFVGYIVLGSLGTTYSEPLGATILTALFTIVLILVIQMLSKRPKEEEVTKTNHYANVGIIIAILIAPLFIAMNVGAAIGPVLSIVIWQFVFSGFGEETFYRGYMQSRLNDAFGRPYEIRGVRFGFGLIISALMFSLAHILNPFDLWTLTGELAIWWGTFTFVGGLIFGLLREWSGSIVPGGLVHGLEAFGEALGVIFS